jgi:putative transposase
MWPKPVQLSFPEPKTWGGRRTGAGRPPTGRKVGVPHRTRPEHKAPHPVHVTLRAARRLPSLRAQAVFVEIRAVLGTIADLARRSRPSFRVIHFSVQRDHMHLIVEARDKTELSRGVAGLSIRTARAINRAARRTGRVFSDRYHGRSLGSPREVRAAMVYVLNNWRKHEQASRGIDSCSSAAWFLGWRDLPDRVEEEAGALGPSPPVAAARTWLATAGWRRYGLLAVHESPASTEP